MYMYGDYPLEEPPPYSELDPNVFVVPLPSEEQGEFSPNAPQNSNSRSPSEGSITNTPSHQPDIPNVVITRDEENGEVKEDDVTPPAENGDTNDDGGGGGDRIVTVSDNVGYDNDAYQDEEDIEK
ncbi:uncharacterized protein LOC144359405 [Saccoglossus kowalevskii]